MGVGGCGGPRSSSLGHGGAVVGGVPGVGGQAEQCYSSDEFSGEAVAVVVVPEKGSVP